MKTVTQLKDMQSQVLAVGDRVAYASYHNLGLTIGIVQKLGRTRAEVAPESKTAFSKKAESFPTENLIKI